MADKAWIKSGKTVIDSSGKVLLCDDCPCEVTQCCDNFPATLFATFSNVSGCPSLTTAIGFTSTPLTYLTDELLDGVLYRHWGSTILDLDHIDTSGEFPVFVFRIRIIIDFWCRSEAIDCGEFDTGTGTDFRSNHILKLGAPGTITPEGQNSGCLVGELFVYNDLCECDPAEITFRNTSSLFNSDPHPNQPNCCPDGSIIQVVISE